MEAPRVTHATAVVQSRVVVSASSQTSGVVLAPTPVVVATTAVVASDHAVSENNLLCESLDRFQKVSAIFSNVATNDDRIPDASSTLTPLKPPISSALSKCTPSKRSRSIGVAAVAGVAAFDLEAALNAKPLPATLHGITTSINKVRKELGLPKNIKKDIPAVIQITTPQLRTNVEIKKTKNSTTARNGGAHKCKKEKMKDATTAKSGGVIKVKKENTKDVTTAKSGGAEKVKKGNTKATPTAQSGGSNKVLKKTICNKRSRESIIVHAVEGAGKDEGHSMSTKCIKSRAFHRAALAAKSQGLEREECMDIAREAYNKCREALEQLQ